MSSLRIAAAQLQSTNDIEANLSHIHDVLLNLTPQTRVICFPENCLYLRIGASSPIPRFDLTERCFAELERVSAARNLGIILGSVPYSENDRLTNAMVFIEPGHKSKVVYRKIHLFDVDVEGELRQRESDLFAAGTAAATLDYYGVKWGLSICYDLRFAELYSEYAKQGCQILVVPSAFLPTTGAAHWEPLLRARAIESQAYVLAPAQAGVHRSKDGEERSTYGHSLVVDPWGRILVEAKTAGPEVLEIDLDLGLLKKVRTSIPQAKHRKLKFS